MDINHCGLFPRKKRIIGCVSNTFGPTCTEAIHEIISIRNTYNLVECDTVSEIDTHNVVKLNEAVFLYCCPDCISCSAGAIQMDPATRAIWAAVKKHILSSPYE